MAPPGEAWIAVLGDNSGITMFHRTPGGEFLYDQGDSQYLSSGSPGLFSQFLSGTNVSLQLGEAPGGGVYGVLSNPNQAAISQSVDGQVIPTQLQYAELGSSDESCPDDSTQLCWWSVQSIPAARLPSDYTPHGGDTLALAAISATGPGSGWGALKVEGDTTNPEPLLFGNFSSSGWSYITSTGLDALDLTGAFSTGTASQVEPQALYSGSDGVWIQAQVGNGAGTGTVIALFDPTKGDVVASWCSVTVLATSKQCANPLDANHPAVMPQAVFDTPQGPVAVGVSPGFVDVYAGGSWSAVAAPGFGPNSASIQTTGLATFVDPTDGWLAGGNSMGEITATAPASPLATWPEPNQATLTSVALPPSGAGIGTPGTLAVGLDGTALHYDPAEGWLVDAIPTSAQGLNLLGVAYDGPAHAVAVGQFGTILDWNGSSWVADPQSTQLTQNQLNAVAFGSDGEGWAVGQSGTILHFDGTSWSADQIDQDDSGTDVTAVAVAGSQAFAVAGGYLITRGSDGAWARVDPSQVPGDGSLTVVSALSDGGVVAAGDSVMIVRNDASSPFQYAPEPFQGYAVALAAFRDPGSGQLRAFVSVAPPIYPQGSQVAEPPSFPAGDGELLLQTNTGFADLSQSQYPVNPNSTVFSTSVPLDGAPEPDPVLAVASSSDGTAAWAVGGYAGSQTGAGLGTLEPLSARPFAWQTSSIWRYDSAGSAQAPSLSQATMSLQAQPDTVSFAFFSSAECVSECAAVQDAQPTVNLSAAASEISSFAAQPGGPAFAMEGGDAVGPLDGSDNGLVDFANLQSVLSPLGGVPLYGAYGPLDAIPGASDPAQAWGVAFAQAPAPFGQGAAPSGITPVGTGGTGWLREPLLLIRRLSERRDASRDRARQLQRGRARRQRTRAIGVAQLAARGRPGGWCPGCRVLFAASGRRHRRAGGRPGEQCATGRCHVRRDRARQRRGIGCFHDQPVELGHRSHDSVPSGGSDVAGTADTRIRGSDARLSADSERWCALVLRFSRHRDGYRLGPGHPSRPVAGARAA